MKTCKSFFHRSLIITSTQELKHALDTKFACRLYGFCLLSCENDYKAQHIIRFTDDYEQAINWLTNNDEDSENIYGVVLGCDL